MQIAWRENTNLRCMVFFYSSTAFFFDGLQKILQYCVVPQTRLDIGNYACALRFPVRLVLNDFLSTYREIRNCIERS